MKIAFINIYQGLHDRGAETYVREVVKGLSVKHKIDIFSGTNMPGNRWPFLWRAYLDPHSMRILSFTIKLLPKLWKEKYDVIIPLNGGWQPALIRLITWLYGGKMIISGQSGIGWDDRNNLWCFPDAFVALSLTAKRWAQRSNPFVKTVYIPNGVDPDKFTPEGKAYKVSLKKPVILCNAALTPAKRIDLVIKAVAKIDASLLVVGDGELKTELNALGNKLMGKSFLIIKVPYAEVDTVYRSADLFTLASLSYFSFEIVLLEAMASGLGVVANKDPIRSEIIADAGVLVNPEDTDNYAWELSSALSRNWDSRPRKQALKFDWNKISDNYDKLFKTLVSK